MSYSYTGRLSYNTYLYKRRFFQFELNVRLSKFASPSNSESRLQKEPFNRSRLTVMRKDKYVVDRGLLDRRLDDAPSLAFFSSLFLVINIQMNFDGIHTPCSWDILAVRPWTWQLKPPGAIRNVGRVRKRVREKNTKINEKRMEKNYTECLTRKKVAHELPTDDSRRQANTSYQSK